MIFKNLLINKSTSEHIKKIDVDLNYKWKVGDLLVRDRKIIQSISCKLEV